MSQPEYEAIVEEIRASRLSASPGLRDRVREIAAAAPLPPRERRGLPWRRWPLVLVPAGAAVAGAAALAVGLATSGKNDRTTTVAGAPVHEVAPQPESQTLRAAPPPADSSTTLRAKSTGGGGSAGAGGLPATRGRAQLYESELTLKVGSLSNATKGALRLTRLFHGYVRSVEYGSGTERGSAYLVVRVPIGSVQAAIVKFSALGEILDQRVSIQDVQPTIDKRFRQMQAIRDRIAKLQAKLESPTLTAEERAALENQLVAERRSLVVLQKQQAALERQTSFATVSLSLRSNDKAVVPHEPGRIGRALDRSGSILLDEVKIVVYVLIVGAPLLALAVLALGGVKVRRRRDEARLLSTS